MSVTTYSELTDYVLDAMERADMEQRVPDFIALAETEFNRSLRTRQMQITITSTPSTGAFDLPTDFLTWTNVVYTGTPRITLEYLDPEALDNSNPTQADGVPFYFSIVGTTDNVGLVRIEPRTTTAINFTYYQKITALTSDNTSNWLLSAHPDLYVAGALYEGHKFLGEFEKMAFWKQCRDDHMASIVKLDQKYRGPSRVRVSATYPTP